MRLPMRKRCCRATTASSAAKTSARVPPAGSCACGATAAAWERATSITTTTTARKPRWPPPGPTATHCWRCTRPWTAASIAGASASSIPAAWRGSAVIAAGRATGSRPRSCPTASCSSKRFSVKKHGENAAKELAIRERERQLQHVDNVKVRNVEAVRFFQERGSVDHSLGAQGACVQVNGKT
ncbi:hypothetical protein GO497_08320 [Acidovorax citrulli]|nr:hypothetical protein [Paracidovorax citrulli]